MDRRDTGSGLQGSGPAWGATLRPLGSCGGNESRGWVWVWGIQNPQSPAPVVMAEPCGSGWEGVPRFQVGAVLSPSPGPPQSREEEGWPCSDGEGGKATTSLRSRF